MPVRVWRGPGGNREVPPLGLLGRAEAKLEEEGGTWGEHGSPHEREPKASVEAHRDPIPRTRVTVLLTWVPATVSLIDKGSQAPARTSSNVLVAYGSTL